MIAIKFKFFYRLKKDEKDVTHIVVPNDKKIVLNWAFISSVCSGSRIVDFRCKSSCEYFYCFAKQLK